MKEGESMSHGPPADLVKDRVQNELRRHPRVIYQKLLEAPEARTRLAAELPALVPFGDHQYHDVIVIIDWDHRLPSRSLIMRLYAYYEAGSAAMGLASYLARAEEISRRDRFPEFDVPDFEGLMADEAYDAAVDLSGKPDRPRLVSDWRRQVAADAADDAVELVRHSAQFTSVTAGRERPAHLGDLEAVGWCPPCESDCPGWTIDVWYLVDFDGLIGRGFSFAVDPDTKTVVNSRELLVRAADGVR
jgi:hypothetical protein